MVITILLKPCERACARLKERLRDTISRKRLCYGIDGIIALINSVKRLEAILYAKQCIYLYSGIYIFILRAGFTGYAVKPVNNQVRFLKPGAFAILKKKGLYRLYSLVP